MKRALEVAVEATTGMGVCALAGAVMWFFTSCDVVDIVVVAPWLGFTAAGVVAAIMEYIEDEARHEAAEEARKAS